MNYTVEQVSAVIRQLKLRQTDIGEALGITQQGVSAKFNGQSTWTLLDIQKLNKILPRHRQIMIDNLGARLTGESAPPVVLPARSGSIRSVGVGVPEGFVVDSVGRFRPSGDRAQQRLAIEERRNQVAVLLERGKSPAEIGKELGFSTPTIRKDIETLRLRGRVAASDSGSGIVNTNSSQLRRISTTSEGDSASLFDFDLAGAVAQ